MVLWLERVEAGEDDNLPKPRVQLAVDGTHTNITRFSVHSRARPTVTQANEQLNGCRGLLSRSTPIASFFVVNGAATVTGYRYPPHTHTHTQYWRRTTRRGSLALQRRNFKCLSMQSILQI